MTNDGDETAVDVDDATRRRARRVRTRAGRHRSSSIETIGVVRATDARAGSPNVAMCGSVWSRDGFATVSRAFSRRSYDVHE
jgi:hypothetical protein